MADASDLRDIRTGYPIPSEGYADQPYVVRTDDGAWLCVMTTGQGLEGAHGQHIITTRSTDHGRTWAAPVAVEPADGPEASYAALLKVPSGRVYCFYNHNTDRVREVKREDGGVYTRVDSLGHYVFKHSDDHGRSWSVERYDVPVREFACDRENVYGGKLRFFWNVGRPLISGNAALLVLHKVGAMGKGFFAQSEGVILRSESILTETDPAKITFETLPDGNVGLRTPPGGGRVSEEQSVTALSDGSLFCVYRTIDGWPACSYSRNGGHAWATPSYLTYTPGGGSTGLAAGRRVKHPRAANFIWRCSNGKFLYWFHNHGGAFLQNTPEWAPYNDRNPVWLMAAREVDSPAGKRLEFSQPEILLYDADPYVRMSYPDLIEEDGRFFVTETQKTIGRVHEIDPALLAGLFGQWDNHTVATDGLALDPSEAVRTPRGAGDPARETVPMPHLPDFTQRDNARADMGSKHLPSGFTLDLAVQFDDLAPGQVLLDSRTPTGQGIALVTTDRGTVELVMNDGRSESRWDCDPGVLQAGRRHRLAAIVDGGPKLVLFVVDGVLCDGGEARQFGWGRFSPNLQNVTGSDTLRLAPALRGWIDSLWVYTRALRVSEVVGNHRG